MDKLKSRKLWVAVLSALLFVAQEQYNEAMGIVLAYLGVQGFIDSK
jgi:uncharacterized membrane protein